MAVLSPQPHYSPSPRRSTQPRAAAKIEQNKHIFRYDTLENPRNRQHIYRNPSAMVLPESKNRVGLGRALMNSNRNARRSVGGGRGRGRGGSSGPGEVVCCGRSYFLDSVANMKGVRADVDRET